MTIKNARLSAGLTQAQMSELLEIPKRTIGDWETGTRKPPIYVEKLIIRELERIAEENNGK
nr:helix-turn-helix transcriptional regulator [Ruminococcus sp.]